MFDKFYLSTTDGKLYLRYHVGVGKYFLSDDRFDGRDYFAALFYSIEHLDAKIKQHGLLESINIDELIILKVRAEEGEKFAYYNKGGHFHGRIVPICR